MTLVNRLKFTTTAASLATITSFTGIAKFRTPAVAIADGKLAVGRTGLKLFAEDANNWEASYFTVGGTAQNPTLTRERVSDSSAAGGPVTFSGTVTVACNEFAEDLTGVSVLDLPLVATAPSNASVEITLADGTAQRIYPGNLQTGSGTPVDNPPTLSALSVSGVTSSSATGSVTTNEVGGTIYWLFSTSSTATAAQVKAGNSQAVTAAGAQSLPGSGLQASTAYYLHVLHRDTYPQDSAVLSLGTAFTTLAAGTPAPTVTGVTISPTSANVAGGGTQQFTTTVAGANSPSQAVNYTITPNTATVNASGLATVPAATGSVQTFTVRATSAQDSSKYAEATITVAAMAAPGQVTGLTAGTPTSSTVPLTWTAASGASAYTVNYRKTGDAAWTAATTTATGTSYTVTGLTASQGYEFQVIATNAGGPGAASATATATTATPVVLPAYTLAGYPGTNGPNAVKPNSPSIDLSVASNYNFNYPPAGKGLTNEKTSINSNGYWYFKRTSDNVVPSRVLSGWFPQGVTPTESDVLFSSASPPSPNPNQNGGTSKNGLVSCGFNSGNGNFVDSAILWVPAGDTGKWCQWFVAFDTTTNTFAGQPVNANPAGLQFTGA
jgi:hypothetical protein